MQEVFIYMVVYIVFWTRLISIVFFQSGVCKFAWVFHFGPIISLYDVQENAC